MSGKVKPVQQGLLDISQYGFIAMCVDRIFLSLEYAAIVQRLFGLQPRGEHHKKLADASDEERVRLVLKNAMRSDSYVLFFVLLETLSLTYEVFATRSTTWRFGVIMIRVISWYRIVDILQNIVNRLILGPLRGRGQNRMASSVRTLILTITAYFEICLCFAALYGTWAVDLIGPHSSVADYVYFSAVTQLTIGYGDIVPVHELRFIAILQGFLGFFFGVVLVSRLISELPRVAGDLEQEV